MSNLATDLSGGGKGGGTWSAATFATTVLLDGNKYMPQQTVGGALAFAPNTTSKTPGGANAVRLIADGVNAPTFPGFTESGASMGYDNRAGVTNDVHFWFDGTDYWYAVLQAVNPIISAVALRFASLAYNTESGNAVTGYTYTSTAGVGACANGPSTSLQSGTDGSYTAVIDAYTGNAGIIGWADQIAGAPQYNDVHFLYGFFAASGTNVYGPISAGAIPTRNGASVTWAAGDVARVRRTGTNAYCEVSKDSGSTWTIIHTYSGVSTAQLWPSLQWTNSGNPIGPIFQLGLT